MRHDAPVDGARLNRDDSRILSWSADTTLRLWGMEFNGLYNICRTPRYHLDALLGFRYLDLSEDLNSVNYSCGGGATQVYHRVQHNVPD